MDAIQKYTVNKDNVVYRIIDREAVILNLDDGNYYNLNETGTEIWEAINGRKEPGRIISRFSKEYGMPQQQLHKDFLAFAEDLAGKGLVRKK